jgi:hypothetical protein
MAGEDAGGEAQQRCRADEDEARRRQAWLEWDGIHGGDRYQPVKAIEVL